MKTIPCLLLLSLISFGGYSNDLESQVSESTPDLDTVLNIYNFCVEKQYSDQDDFNMETYLLDCVNVDLITAAYQTFNSYNGLIEFISSDKGE